MTSMTPDPHPARWQDPDHEARELEVIRGVLAYLALTGGHGLSCGNPLWLLAEAHGWTLDAFVESCLDLGGDLVTQNIDHGTRR
jgi:hypothetical protein